MHLPPLKALLVLLFVGFAVTSCNKHNSPSNIKKEVFSKVDKAEQLSNFIEEALKAAQIIPAVSIAVVDKNGPVFVKAFGYADFENKTIADEKTNFYIASCTKSFNGLLAHILEEEGRIDLSKEIIEYRPFKNFRSKAAFKGVTVMDLLSHQSGLENPYLTFRLAYSGAYKQKEILKLIEQETYQTEIKQSFNYTNLGYYFLGALFQAELGKSWKELLEEKVFLPLQMKNTTAFISKSGKAHLALPHLGAFKDSVHIAQLMKTDKTMHPAGGLVANADDIAKYLSFYINSGNINNQQVYPQSLVENTYKKQVSQSNVGEAFSCHGYGSGWLLGKLNEQNLVLHYGAYEGFRAHISFMPEEKLGVAVFINHEFAMPFINEIVQYAYNLYLGEEQNSRNQERSMEREITEHLSGYQNWIVEREQKMERGTWKRALPISDYIGTYHNSKLGTLEVEKGTEGLVVICGNMGSIAMPHLNENCFWVKLTSQSGEGICFNIENEEVKSINYKENIYIRRNQH